MRSTRVRRCLAPAALLLMASVGCTAPTATGNAARPALDGTDAMSEVASERSRMEVSSSGIGAVPTGLPSEWPAALAGALPPATFVALSGIDGHLVQFDRDGLQRREPFRHDVFADVSVDEGVVAMGRSTPVLYSIDDALAVRAAMALPGTYDSTYTGAMVTRLDAGGFLVGYTTHGSSFVQLFDPQSAWEDPIEVADQYLTHMNSCVLDQATVLVTTNTDVMLVDLQDRDATSVLHVPEGVGGLACGRDGLVAAAYDSGVGYTSPDGTDWHRADSLFADGTRTLAGHPDGFFRVTTAGLAQRCTYEPVRCDDLPGEGHLMVQVNRDHAAVLATDGRVVIVDPRGNAAPVRLQDSKGHLHG